MPPTIPRSGSASRRGRRLTELVAASDDGGGLAGAAPLPLAALLAPQTDGRKVRLGARPGKAGSLEKEYGFDAVLGGGADS